MPTKWDRFRDTLNRAHRDFEFPTAEFLNYNETGLEKGNVVGSYQSIGTLDVEFVPPTSDSTVDEQGTHDDFSTRIRVPTSDLDELDESLIAYGADDQKPTRVDIEAENYEIQAILPENGSGMTHLPLIEL